MGKKRKKETEEIVDVSGAEKFIEENFKNLLFAVIGVIALAMLFIFIAQSGKGKEKKAETMAIKAQEAFAQDNWALAIEGDDNQSGFQDVVDNYKNTKIGNLSQYYLGVSYMNQQNYDKAIEELKKYKPTKDPNVNGLAYKNIADALSEIGKPEESLVYYKKAANTDSEAFQDDFIYTYAMAQINAGKLDGARASFDRLTKEFPKSSHVAAAENYLAGL